MCSAKLRLKRLAQKMAVDAALEAPGKAKEMEALVDRFLSNKGVPSKEMAELLDDIVPAPKLKGATSMAATPRLPFLKPEKWYFLFGDTKANFVYVNACLELGEAEEAGFKQTVLDAFAAACTAKAKGSNKEEEIKRKLFDLGSQQAYSQVVRMGYVSPPAGNYNLTLQIMCDSYLGADYKFERKVKVDTKARAAGEPSAAEEATGNKKKGKPVQNGGGDTDSSASAQTQLKTSKIKEVEDEDEEATVSSDDEITQAAPSSCASKGCCPPKAAGADSDSDSEDSVFSDFSYDSEDTGTDIEEEDGTQERKVWTVMPKQD